MPIEPAELPDDIAQLKAMLLATAKRARIAEAKVDTLDAEIANLKLTIAKMRRDRFGSSSEHEAKLDQLELQLAELVERAAENTFVHAIADPVTASELEQRKPARRALPAHLPRERRLHAALAACPCCSGTSFRKLGEDTTETLERVPAQWKVVVHVRERLACRTCVSFCHGHGHGQSHRLLRASQPEPTAILTMTASRARAAVDTLGKRLHAALLSSRPTGSLRATPHLLLLHHVPGRQPLSSVSLYCTLTESHCYGRLPMLSHVA